MVHKKFRAFTQVVGCVTIALLAVYGLLTLLDGGSVLAESLDKTYLAGSNVVIPATFNYQGLLRETDGNLATGAFTITAKIYSEPTGGSDLYHETFTNVTVRDGLFNVVLGDAPGAQDLQAVFGAAPRYIGITLDGGDELIPRQRLHGVPWALYATHASEAADFAVSGALTAGSVNVTGDIGWSGHLSTITYTAPITVGTGASVNVWTWQTITDTPPAHSVCFLVHSYFNHAHPDGNANSGSLTGCRVEPYGDNWRVGIYLGDPSNGTCAARCLKW